MRKKYKPKPIRLDTMHWVLSGMKSVSSVPHGGITLKIKNHDALTNITQGRGTRHDIDVVIAAMNIAEALALARTGGQRLTLHSKPSLTWAGVVW